MSMFLSIGKELLKNIALGIITKKSSDEETFLFKVILGILGSIFFLVLSIFAFICLTPLAILGNIFSGLDFDNVTQIKSDSGYVQKQDIAFMENEGIKQTQVDENGNVKTIETKEYSNITIEENGSSCVYFNQADSRWANHPYAGSTSYWAACGPTSMSMVVSTLTGKNIPPPEMMDIATRSGYACDGAGSYHSIVPGLARKFNLKCTGIGSNGPKLKKALQEGKLVVALMGPGDFTKNGHFIVLRGITSDGRVLVNDPASTKRTNMSWDFNKFPQQSIKWADVGGPFWVIEK